MVVLTLFFCFMWALILSAAKATGESCLLKGFDQEILQCKTCDLITKIVADEEIIDDCKKCCKTETHQRYELAVFEIDKRLLTSFPELENVSKKADKLGIDMRFRYGSRPTLYLFKNAGDDSHSDSISVHSWDLPMFKEFLLENLKK